MNLKWFCKWERFQIEHRYSRKLTYQSMHSVLIKIAFSDVNWEIFIKICSQLFSWKEKQYLKMQLDGNFLFKN